MIIHASTKMDISNYINWLHKRLQEGFFDQEVNPKVINRIALKDIEELNLYCRTPQKIYRNRDLFKQYNTKLITFLSMYDHYYEPKVKDKTKVMDCIRKSKKYFRNYIGYGPVFLTSYHDMEWHIKQFEFILSELSHFIDGVYIDFSINENCQKTPKLGCMPLDMIEQNHILEDFETIAAKYNLSVELFRRENEFEDNEIDIGSINCCPHACGYCINITNSKSAMDKYKVFNQDSSMLYGIISSSQKIVEIDLSSTKKEDKTFVQQSLFDLM